MFEALLAQSEAWGTLSARAAVVSLLEGKNETFGIVTQSPKVQRWRARNARVHLGGRHTFAPAISASVSADPS